MWTCMKRGNAVNCFGICHGLFCKARFLVKKVICKWDVINTEMNYKIRRCTFNEIRYVEGFFLLFFTETHNYLNKTIRYYFSDLLFIYIFM